MYQILGRRKIGFNVLSPADSSGQVKPRVPFLPFSFQFFACQYAGAIAVALEAAGKPNVLVIWEMIMASSTSAATTVG